VRLLYTRRCRVRRAVEVGALVTAHAPRCPTCGGPIHAVLEDCDGRLGAIETVEYRCLWCHRLAGEYPLNDPLAEARRAFGGRSKKGRPGKDAG
jgi:hypothetical protein